MYLCDMCSDKFPKTPQGKKDWLHHRAKHKGVEIKTEPTAKSMSAQEIKKEKKKKAVKPELTYQWKGECPTCYNFLESIDMEIEGKFIVVAFCATCKKEVAYRPVTKL